MGFSSELALVHETRDSNAQFHDYRRTSGELRFVQQSPVGAPVVTAGDTVGSAGAFLQ